jgi:hypothetical protein
VTEDERWALYVTVPALVLSLPLYIVSTAVFYAARESLGLALEYFETCHLLEAREERQDDEVAA